MDKVKARKQGNAIMVTLAKKFNVSEGQEFYITQEKDGAISLIPKIEDYFADVVEGEFVDDEDKLARSISTIGSELDE
ncbi:MULTISPECIES: type II toxin-antitoxin system PemI/MazE family antitoxin [Enterococcaceae]|uniref:AbrB family transcriptional regulator n=3 Tax=Tetragenococcus halophilus TaxID=51669 RepID=A0A2H6CVD0_TETHA|nr:MULTISPECIES: AbrB family transcriptional regulator [Enterococcaceae]MDN5810253.1 AbrB family transcriptional regulator [Tetragenococcus koreensis]AOF48431.1 AbrB family transcriptional regulator [Tetragenococcus halophilus]AYW49889.1 AbrB family transcriptional regulator [Tetragenococcus halophilus]MCF1602897.1 AbrB family transcriptional regulator [Tetragenococcus halophilus]MCF1676874.1 AbrB family transcriptional regulator [Tetragenococcus halophilus]